MSKYFTYILFRIIILKFKYIPFKILYLISDFVYFFLYHIIEYRKKTVYDNLKMAFPEKSEAEITAIAKKFYKNLADISMESLKGISMRNQTLIERYRVVNPEIMDELHMQKKSVIGIGSHYANWEWGVLAFSMQFPHTCYGLYKPIKNKYINNYFKKSRAKNNMHLYSIKETRELFESTPQKPALYFMISDQSPSNLYKAIWVDFLNQQTACLHGPAFYAKNYNLPIVYGDVQRTKRGFYEITLIPIILEYQMLSEEAITQTFMKQLEDIIRKNPSDWLWSHKRWKHKKSDA